VVATPFHLGIKPLRHGEIQLLTTLPLVRPLYSIRDMPIRDYFGPSAIGMIRPLGHGLSPLVPIR
jgi:hypothetical protein